MISAILIAATLGILTTYALIGRSSTAPAAAATFAIGLPLIGVSGAGIGPEGITVGWAVGMALAVGLGMLLAPRMPGSRGGAFAGATALMIAIAVTVSAVRWLVPMAADLAGLNQPLLALLVVASGAAWAVGGRWTAVRTVMWLAVAAAVLLLILGVAVGTPDRLTSPLLDVGPAAGTGIIWLVLVFLTAALHPGLRRGASMAGVGITVAVLLVGLVGLLAFLGGYVRFPSTALYVIPGYATFGPGVPGSILAVPFVLAAAVACGATLRSALTALHGQVGSFTWLAERRWAAAVIVAAVVYVLVMAPIPIVVLMVVVVIAGVIGLLVDLRAGDSKSVEQPAEQVDQTVAQ